MTYGSIGTFFFEDTYTIVLLRTTNHEPRTTVTTATINDCEGLLSPTEKIRQHQHQYQQVSHSYSFNLFSKQELTHP